MANYENWQSEKYSIGCKVWEARCPNCHELVESAEPISSNYRFCPYCGFDMQSAEQNDQYVFIHELISEFKESKRLLKVAMYNKWINAKEQKPEAYEDVLVLFEYYFCGGNTTKLKIGTAYYVKDGDKWLGDDLYALPDTNVIYWQPLLEPLDDGWLEKEVENIELNMSLEDAYRHIKSSYIHHMHERNAVFLSKAELIALMCIKQAVAESKEDKK